MGRTIAQDLSLVPPSGMSLLFQVQVQIVLTSHVLYHMGCAYCGTLAPATPLHLNTPPPRCSQLLGLATFSQINLGYRSLCLPGVSYFISFL